MFKIYDGREYFYQWDIDRKLIIEDPDVKEVHFTNRATNDAYVCETYAEDDKTLVNVPNILLQTNWRIQVYAYDGKHTKHDKCYEVRGRSKPVDYVYTETEVKNFSLLESQIEEVDNRISNVSRGISEVEDKVSGLVYEIKELDKTTESFSNQISDLDFDVISMENTIYSMQGVISEKQDKTIISTTTLSDGKMVFSFDGYERCSSELRVCDNVTNISFIFGDGDYPNDYMSGLSFNSGETPTAIDYTDSGILNWVGTDCSVADGYSIFKPAANKHYEIVFYFNGTQFIGLVNGFVPSLGNVVE